MDEDHGEQPPVLAVEVDRELVERQEVSSSLGGPPSLLDADHGEEARRSIVMPRSAQVTTGCGRAGRPRRARRLAAAERSSPSSLLSQPMRDWSSGLLRGGRAPRRLAVGARRAGHVAAAHARGRQRLPGTPGQRILGRLRGRDPGLQRGRLIVEAVAALGEPEQRGGVQGRVRAAHDARERAGGEVPVALVGERLAALQQPDRDVAVERPGAAGRRRGATKPGRHASRGSRVQSRG